MTDSTVTAVDRERIAAVLDEYLLAKEQGQQLDQTEFVARFPEIADEVRECLQSIEFMNHASASFGGALESESCSETLGDFRLIRELGRGGMGVVYEAEQLTLGRLVAVKVLPFAALLDKRQLTRFKNEARAAAMLQHPNIVSVHSVGCERGVHFYAMELIDGQSIAQVVSELQQEHHTELLDDTKPVAVLSTLRSCQRSAFYRHVAELGIQAADALEYAHQEGVIHRDIKPSNLLLDETGQLHVADFGLARIQSAESLTASQDVLGTLRYMSPEQSEGKYLDHRTDIYSLGATLYELLTMKPALDGQDREELYRQLTDLRPIHPRRIDATIPRDLELVVLKAISPIAEHRYRSAKDFSADLSRFLSSEPVRAQRTGRFHYAQRWIQRNKALATTSFTSLVLLVGLAVVGPLAAWKYARLAEDKTVALERETAALVREKTSRLKELRFLGDSVIEIVTALQNVPGIDEEMQSLIDETMSHYSGILDASNVDLSVKHEVAKAFFEMSNSLFLRGHGTKGRPLLQLGLTTMEELLEEEPNNVDYNVTYADLTFYQDNSSATCRRCIEILERAVKRRPNNLRYRHSLAWYQLALGNHWPEENSSERNSERIRSLRRAIQIAQQLPPNHPSKAERSGLLGFCLSALARTSNEGPIKTEELYRNARSHFEPIKSGADSGWWNTYLRYAAAKNLAEYGVLLLKQDRTLEAEALLDEAQESFTSLHRDFPHAHWGRRVALEVAAYFENSGDLESSARWYVLLFPAHSTFQDCRVAERIWRSGGEKAARGLFQICIERSDPVLQCYLLASCYDESLRDPKRALEIAKGLDNHNHNLLQHLGVAHYRCEHWQLAIDAIQQAMNAGQADAFDHFFLAMAHAQLGNDESATQEYELGCQRINETLVRTGPNPSHFDPHGVNLIAAEAALVVSPGSRTAN